MDPSAIDRNTKASLNGQFCEEFAIRNVPGLEWVGGLFDATWNGKPVDVKGCEAWYSRSDRVGQRRAGQVTLEQNQDSEIKKLDGLYFCVVHIGQLVVDSFFVPAVKIEFHSGSTKRVSWPTMQKISSEAC